MLICLWQLWRYFLTTTANVTFFSTSHVSIPIGKLRTFFIASLAVVLTGVLLLLLVLLGYRHTLKTVAICFILIATFAGHFTDTYGTVYDTTMLQNALQTDTAETKDLLSMKLFNPCCVVGWFAHLLDYWTAIVIWHTQSKFNEAAGYLSCGFGIGWLAHFGI